MIHSACFQHLQSNHLSCFWFTHRLPQKEKAHASPSACAVNDPQVLASLSVCPYTRGVSIKRGLGGGEDLCLGGALEESEVLFVAGFDCRGEGDPIPSARFALEQDRHLALPLGGAVLASGAVSLFAQLLAAEGGSDADDLARFVVFDCRHQLPPAVQSGRLGGDTDFDPLDLDLRAR